MIGNAEDLQRTPGPPELLYPKFRLMPAEKNVVGVALRPFLRCWHTPVPWDSSATLPDAYF